jgi:hypothetical protein
VIAKKTQTFFERSGYLAAATLVGRLPAGLRTGYQRDVERRVWTGLFGLGDDVSTADARLRSLRQVLGDDERTEELHAAMERELGEFSSRRAYVADVISSATTWFAAWFLYHDSSLGIFDLGRKLAGAYARKRAAKGFFLGEGIGNAFYSVVPVAPTGAQVFWASVATLLFLTALSVVVSYLSEPAQHALGVQKRQLTLVLDGLRKSSARRSRPAETRRSRG